MVKRLISHDDQKEGTGLPDVVESSLDLRFASKTQVDGKADTEHTHTFTGVEGLQEAIDGRVVSGVPGITLWQGTQEQYDALPEATRNNPTFWAAIV